MTPRLRLGVDIGTNSLGWALLALDADAAPVGLVDAGVRIFSSSRDPESNDPLGKARREARQPRRQRDRRLQRKRLIVSELVQLGLMPHDPAARKHLATLDPYPLRGDALDRALSRHELGRALFHLAQRRGFKSNRLADDKDDGLVRESINALAAEMRAWGSRTLGQHMLRRLSKGERARGQFWTAREMLEAEFDTIVTEQTRRDATLGDPSRFARLRGLIFHQRDLKPQPVGVCTIDGTSPRAPNALPLVQELRILQEVANLRLTIPPDPQARPLSPVERDRLLVELRGKADVDFARVRKVLRLPADTRFNLEGEVRKKLKGDAVAAKMAHRDLFGRGWRGLPSDRQQAIVERLLAEPEEAAVRAFARDLGLPEAAATKLARVRLPQGHSRFGLPVIRAVVPILRERGIDLADAVREAGFHHSDFRPDGTLDALPYYGAVLGRWCLPVRGPSAPADEREHGRIANPTVHVGLNQLRKLVNAVIERHGRPAAIHVELARELKLGRDRLAELDAQQRQNRARNERADEALKACGMDPLTMGRGQLAEYRRRYRLWLELDETGPQRRLCPYSGRPIGIGALVGSGVEIEHILPFSRTLDDSMANLTVAYIDANRDKGERTPFEAFHDSPTVRGRRYEWEEIAARASRMPKNKAWRFAADAMARFEGEGGFVDRQLSDTTYLSRLTQLYLQHVCRDVVALPGRLTALLRDKWGLNELLAQGNWKNREDHRHHAIDAAVVATTDRRTLQRFAREDDRGRQRIVVPPPWPTFRAELGARLASMIVSHKPEHGIAGRLHDETAYGPTPERNARGVPCYAVRWSLDKLDKPAKLAAIRDPHLRQRLTRHVESALAQGVGWKEAVASYRDEAGQPLRHVRVLVPFEDASLVPVRDGHGGAFKFYPTGSNAYMDVLRLPNGRWVGWAVSSFDANRLAMTSGAPAWKAKYPAARRVMRLFKGDLVAIEEDGARRILKVLRLRQDGVVYLAEHQEGGRLDKRHASPDDPFRFRWPAASTLPRLQLRRIGVDALGRLRDPGFHS